LFGGELCAGNSAMHGEMLEIINSNWNKI
jgi:hypothetical protein